MKNLRENHIIFTLKIFWKAFGSYRYRMGLLLGISLMGGIFEGIGINSIIPLFSFVIKEQNKASDFISKYTEYFFNFFHIPYELKYLLVLIALLFVGKSIVTFLTNYITDKIRTDYVKKTRDQLFRLTLQSNWSYLSRQRIGHLEKVLMTDINTYSALLSYMSSSVIVAINACMYAFIVYSISPEITLITIALGGIFFLAFKPLVYQVRIVSHQSANLLKKIAHHINESMIGMKTIKAMNLEEAILERSAVFFEELRRVEMKVSVLSSLTYVITQPLSIFLIIGLFAYSYKLTNFNFASFAVIVYAINKIFTYVQDAQSRIQNINALYPFLRTAAEYETLARNNQERLGSVRDINLRQDIVFKDVSFNYSAGKETLLNINITIPQGKIVGVVGPSGAGKTTFVDLLLGLINPTSGKIHIGQTDVTHVDKGAWRNHVGYVSQDVFLVNDTIENNIRLYDPSISKEAMIQAARMANIYDFIQKQPLGFATPVGERGMEISGGQRQRIALARVLARAPQIIILDEATSALDSESEVVIQKAIESLKGKVTLVIIAHKPSTIKSTDLLIVLQHGQISEHGSPDSLLANKNSYFSKMYESHAL